MSPATAPRVNTRGLVFSPHAAARMERRGITQDDARRVLDKPFHVQRTKGADRMRYIAPAVIQAKREWLVVVVNVRSRVVVTAFTHRGRK